MSIGGGWKCCVGGVSIDQIYGGALRGCRGGIWRIRDS